jgi:hypothetical protein
MSIMSRRRDKDKARRGDDPYVRSLIDRTQEAAQMIQQRRPQMQQARVGALQQQLQSLQPVNAMLGRMYGDHMPSFDMSPHSPLAPAAGSYATDPAFQTPGGITDLDLTRFGTIPERTSKKDRVKARRSRRRNRRQDNRADRKADREDRRRRREARKAERSEQRGW